MAETPAASALESGSTAREIRVFLSSTFRDFNKERELLATRVFPELNRRARERGVELVEVDLRWGVTQAQAEDGHALEICLQEIERCQRYFIGMLGDSYGSLTPPERQLLVAAPDLLEKRQWLSGLIGAASYTELEIEQRLQQMGGNASDGRAFFYFRDPAYSDAKADAGEPGWRSDTAEDRQKLALLRERIANSGYALVEGLADPQAIADRIEADLWALIERLFPQEEQPDALQKEARKHADYRKSRTKSGQYIGGEGYLSQLEGWIDEGQQQILVTGESGAGKSTLLANWIERHQQEHPADVVYAHHLGCTNDASALRPLLGRLIDTASAQLLEAEVITEALAVPEDWWELVAKVSETLQSLGRYHGEQGKRWIWVLDGLDRLDPDDQNALPWLPQQLPDGVQVVASALACPAREILQERGYTTLTINPLSTEEQGQLILRYLQRYTKELDGGLRQLILAHPLSGSPLFLKVLLEELRQCGRHDTLKDQLAFYLSSQTVDDLYERVLERLENDGSAEAVKQVMTALWASRAGLTEAELLAITGLARLQWAPIDLALEQAFGRNGNRLVFDHDYLRIAVQDRYLPKEDNKIHAHEKLAKTFQEFSGIDSRVAEELPWQLGEANLRRELMELLLDPKRLGEILLHRPSREIANLWNQLDSKDYSIDELLETNIESEITSDGKTHTLSTESLIHIANLLDEMGLHRSVWLRLRQAISTREFTTSEQKVEALLHLANAYHQTGKWNEALQSYQHALKTAEENLKEGHRLALTIINNLGNLYSDLDQHAEATRFYELAFKRRKEELGHSHPDTLRSMNNLGNIYSSDGKNEKAEAMYIQTLSIKRNTLGIGHRSTLNSLYNLAIFYDDNGRAQDARDFYKAALEGREKLLGENHRETLMAYQAYGQFLGEQGDRDAAEEYIARSLEKLTRVLGDDHPDSLHAACSFAALKTEQGAYEEAESCYKKLLDVTSNIQREETRHNHVIHLLAECLSQMGRHEEAIEHRRIELAWCLENHGSDDAGSLESMSRLAWDLQQIEQFDEALELRNKVFEISETSEQISEDDTMGARYRLAGCLSQMGRYEEAIEQRRIELMWRRERDGQNNSRVLNSIEALATDLLANGESQQGELLMRELEISRQHLLDP